MCFIFWEFVKFRHPCVKFRDPTWICWIHLLLYVQVENVMSSGGFCTCVHKEYWCMLAVMLSFFPVLIWRWWWKAFWRIVFLTAVFCSYAGFRLVLPDPFVRIQQCAHPGLEFCLLLQGGFNLHSSLTIEPLMFLVMPWVWWGEFSFPEISSELSHVPACNHSWWFDDCLGRHFLAAACFTVSCFFSHSEVCPSWSKDCTFSWDLSHCPIESIRAFVPLFVSQLAGSKWSMYWFYLLALLGTFRWRDGLIS